jgi:hypothetical protein
MIGAAPSGTAAEQSEFQGRKRNRFPSAIRFQPLAFGRSSNRGDNESKMKFNSRVTGKTVRPCPFWVGPRGARHEIGGIISRTNPA